ncbi:LysR family transcriptional regulator, hydrogen peroxide-inducible genes activator [Methylophilus rhizosphaerae]|uniref:LysR family transcriptional regulator, hydrogen peroxide-inducible genes activator n=1 Tax=Methylophilus rhizosphaerae TaxID=492660 RepID=A0A1G9EE78_9PROT|nr:hydrogen peroxide-inducible genes activator [Methylophilus rhizosphaerae]SDK74452.1 LysR family transcriptional regulator, hydrogen peroxide-inducible genes activator [Methylophilus rhizosphaerae]
MTLIELKFVLAVAQERNFRRAAEKCFVTQPALSLGIKKLEEELGVSLFERNRNEVTPTTIGEQIIAQANIVLEQAGKIKEMAKQGNDPLNGTFKLGIIHSVGPYLLPEMIPPLVKMAPHMPLEVEENITATLEQQLRNGVIDAAVVALPFDVPGVETIPLYDEDFNVVVPVNHPWAHRKTVSPDELSNEKVLLLNTGHCFSNQVTQACPELNRKGEVLQGNSLETIRNMVASNLGITVLPAMATAARYQNPLLQVIPFTKPAPSRRIALAWRKSFVRTAAIEVLEKVMSDIGKQQTTLTIG